MEIQTTNVFDRVWHNMKRVNLLRGGSRSSKSWSLTAMVMLWLKTGYIGENYIPEGRFGIIRETFPALRMSVLRDFINFLHEQDFYKFVDYSKSTHTVRYKRREVVFIPADDPEKLKGQQWQIAWFNEMTSIDYDSFYAVLMRCENMVFGDYNPSEGEDHWIKQKLEDDWLINRDYVTLDVSTIYDNNFLHPSIIAEIERIEDHEIREIYLKGNWTRNTGKIYANWTAFDEWPEYHNRMYYGMDFGFANDPTALVEIRETDDAIYVKEILYEKGLTNMDIVDKVGIPQARVIADSAVPKDIEDLRRMGWWIKPSYKGKDSVINGIMLVKSKKIYYYGPNLEKEMKTYKWELHKDTGEPTNKPLSVYGDHLLDAVRYGIQFHNKAMKFKILDII